MMRKTILIFGYGYVSRFLINKLSAQAYKIYCTSRKIASQEEHASFTLINFSHPKLPKLINSAEILLSTIPPTAGNDPVLEKYYDFIARSDFTWIGYLSATSVYGDHDGMWVDETSLCLVSNSKRLQAEKKWQTLKFPVDIFRLSGIYGPRRNCLDKIINGKNYTVVKENQYFSRIHIADICQIIITAFQRPMSGEIFNISDDEPAYLNVVQQYGAKLLSKPKLQEIPFSEANLSVNAKNFFNNNKRISNKKMKQNYEINLLFPTFREGLINEYMFLIK